MKDQFDFFFSFNHDYQQNKDPHLRFLIPKPYLCSLSWTPTPGVSMNNNNSSNNDSSKTASEQQLLLPPFTLRQELTGQKL